MQTNLAYATYNQNNIGIESPHKLITMLYEGVLRFVYRAKRAIDEEDIQTKVLFLNKSSAIFVELINALDMKQGAISEYLNGLYAHQISLIAKANYTNDKAPLDEVVNVTRSLLEAWREVTSE